jgi:hypothetical protein
MPVDYPILKSELQTDPRGYGYAPYLAGGDMQGPTDLLNAVRDGTNPGTNPTADGGQADGTITIRRMDVTPNEILEVLDIRDFEPDMTVLDAAYFGAVMQQTRLRLALPDGSNSRILGNLRRLLLNTDLQGSEVRLLAVANRLGSRAEELFGPNTVVAFQDVIIALRDY